MATGSSWLQTLVLTVPIVGIPAWAMFGPEGSGVGLVGEAAAEADGGFELDDVGGDAPVAPLGEAPVFGELPPLESLDGPAESDEFAPPERLGASVGAMSSASAETPGKPLETRIELTQGREEDPAASGRGTPSVADLFASLDDISLSPVARGATRSERGWERVVAELRRHEVENLRVTEGSRPGTAYVSCTLPDRPLGGRYGVVPRRFEAEAGDRVAAAEAVLAQITRWRR